MYHNNMGRGRGWPPPMAKMMTMDASATEKPRTQILPTLSPRGAKLREELLKKILPWEKIVVSFDDFPYYIEERIKSLLVECVASNLKHNELRKYSAGFNSSSRRILLQSMPGTELYRERVVSAVARELQVPLLRLDGDHGCDEEKKHRYCSVPAYPHPASRHTANPKTYNKTSTLKKGDRIQYIGMDISFEEANNSINLAILRFMEEADYTSRPKKKLKTTIKDLARGNPEQSLVSALVLAEDIGVKFDDVGVHENVKKVLYATVILPMRKPELFSHGNMLRPCNGILLFGPPGTGKTLVVKALAKESGANFIHITAANFSSTPWFWALFSFASKLAPAIIYLDEVDTLPGARGRDKNGTSKLYEFMEAWDHCKSKESQRIVLIGATNRPFDLNEDVLRHMPRRIYVGLPDLEIRSKILKVLLNKENLESGFSFDHLAEATEGYSGRDLKNLCAASLDGPIKEFLEQESKGEASDGAPVLRPLNLNDFVHSKSKVRPSIALDASSNIKLREWKEQYGEGEGQI